MKGEKHEKKVLDEIFSKVGIPIINIKLILPSYSTVRTIRTNIQEGLIACGALAASISVGIVIPSTWFFYLYKQTVSITVVVMGTKQFNDKTTHRQHLKTGFVQKWENRSPGLFQELFHFSRTQFLPNFV